MIDLYTAPTPNGFKVSILLEELEIPYHTITVSLDGGDQKQPEFFKLNPNGRIPVIVDRNEDNWAVFESGAILIYLSEKSGTFLPANPKDRSRVIQWLMFQMGGIGPMQGQAHVFYRYAPETIDYAIKRYQRETRRLYAVLNSQLQDNEYLAGDLSIADIACWPWVRIYKWAGVDLEELPHLERWMEVLNQRPAFQKGIMVPCSVEQVNEPAKNSRKRGSKILI